MRPPRPATLGAQAPGDTQHSAPPAAPRTECADGRGSCARSLSSAPATAPPLSTPGPYILVFYIKELKKEKKKPRAGKIQ